MLIFNAKRVFALRDVENPYQFMLNNGFSRTITYNLLGNNPLSSKFKHIERLCALLNCTPNDLFEYKPDSQMPLAESHSLNSLKREGMPEKFSDMMKDLPIEKLSEIQNLIGELKNQ